MSRPAKTYLQLVTEQKSHRTKSELETRKKSEESLLSGKKMMCRIKKKDNEVAYNEFKRIEKLYANIDKNDALYEGILNRYCELFSECKDFENKRNIFYDSISELKEDNTLNSSISFGEYMKLRMQLQQQVLNLDKQIMNKRSMLLAIEKEMAMTLAAALRAVSKKPTEEEDPNADLF